MQVGSDDFAISLGVRTAQLDMALVRIARLEQENAEMRAKLGTDDENDKQPGLREVPDGS